jgi:pilus assembly protein Flp/PilA
MPPGSGFERWKHATQLLLNVTFQEPSMSRLVSRFARNKSGATAIEYGLIAAIMAVALIAAFPTITSSLKTAFNTIANGLNTTA